MPQRLIYDNPVMSWICCDRIYKRHFYVFKTLTFHFTWIIIQHLIGANRNWNIFKLNLIQSNNRYKAHFKELTNILTFLSLYIQEQLHDPSYPEMHITSCKTTKSQNFFGKKGKLC